MRERAVFGLGDGELPGSFDGGPFGGVRAAVAGQRWLPGLGALVALGLVEVVLYGDEVHERIAFPNKDIEDFVILRSDRTPIYNMAVVSDDIAMRITLVMRGDDHISNTPKQILLYRALGEPLPQFAGTARPGFLWPPAR